MLRDRPCVQAPLSNSCVRIIGNDRCSRPRNQPVNGDVLRVAGHVCQRHDGESACASRAYSVLQVKHTAAAEALAGAFD